MSSSDRRPASFLPGLLLALLVLPGVAHALAQSVTPEPEEVADPAVDPAQATPSPQDDSTTLASDAVGQDVRDARAALDGGGQSDDVLSIHAITLLAAGDMQTLRKVLAGTRRNAVLGVLSALKVRFADELLDAVTDLAAGTTDAEIRARALDGLRELVRSRPDVLEALVRRLGQASLDGAVRRLVVETLGNSRDLRAVPALLEELRGPAAAQADAGLGELSGHRPRRPVDPATYWPVYWERNAGVPRDVLLELELRRERDEHAEEMARKNDEIVSTRISNMGNDVDKLMTEVTDEFQRVRLTAVQRLNGHPNTEQAANSVPLLLRRLGYGAGDVHGNGGNGSANGSANGADVARETDDEVRTAIVSALGVLGRGRADVQEVLLDVVRNAVGPIASAAVDALWGERDQPQVVPPLLQYIGRSEVSSATLVKVLRIIAQNQPHEAFAELAPWMSPSYDNDVRAAAVEAVLADSDLGPALASVASLTSPDQPKSVRFALALALGKRLRAPVPPSDDVRPRILALLADLSDDIDESVRGETAGSLGELRSVEALAVLEDRSLRETVPSVVEKLVAALGALRLDGCIPIIGRICGRWTGDDPERLQEAARAALLLLGEGRDANAWLEMATSLREAGSPGLSVWACGELIRRFDGSAPAREALQRARGVQVEGLWLEGKAREAHDSLVELHESRAPFPNSTRRLELLAMTSEALGLWDEAAQSYAQLLEQQGEGEANRLPTRRAYAVALMESGRDEDALAEIVSLLAEGVGDSDLELRQGLVLERLGRGAEAEDVFLRLLERLSADDESMRARASEALARVAAALGRSADGPGADASGDGDGQASGSDADLPTSDDGGGASRREDNR